jgi:hypothetical protein
MPRSAQIQSAMALTASSWIWGLVAGRAKLIIDELKILGHCLTEREMARFVE